MKCSILLFTKKDGREFEQTNPLPGDLLKGGTERRITYNNNNIIYSIYRALIPNDPKALYIIKITKS